MKKIITICFSLSFLTNNHHLLGMLLTKHPAIKRKNSILTRTSHYRAQFNYYAIIIDTQKKNIALKEEIEFLKQEIALIKTTITEQADGLTDRQRTKNFMSTDRDRLTYPEKKSDSKE